MYRVEIELNGVYEKYIDRVKMGGMVTYDIFYRITNTK